MMFFKKLKGQLPFYYSASTHSFKPNNFQQINTVVSFFVAIQNDISCCRVKESKIKMLPNPAIPNYPSSSLLELASCQ